MLPIVSRALGLLADIPTLAACRERMELAKETIRDLGQKLEEAHAEIQDLKAELKSRPSLEFVEHRGALWKRSADGNYALDPYCPIHRVPLSQFADLTVCTVTECGYAAPFAWGEKRAIHASIPNG